MAGYGLQAQISIWSFILIVPSVLSLPCTQKQINLCLAHMDGYEYEIDNAIVPTMDEKSFKEHCRRYDLFEDCMVDVKPQCTSADKLIFQGIEDAYQWMCHDAIDEYLLYRDCFTNKEIHIEGDKCNVTLTDSLNSVRKNDHSTDDAVKRICLYVEQYLDCVENIVTSFCGEDAASWQRTLDTKSLEPLMNGLGCSLYGTSGHQWIVYTISVLLTITTVIIVVSIVMVIMRKRKRRPQNTTRQDVPGAPPPYELNVAYTPSSQAAGGGLSAGPLPEKSAVEPPPYQPLAEVSIPPASVYNNSSTTSPAAPQAAPDAGVAAGYFGVGAAVGSTPYTSEPEKDGEPDSMGFSNPSYTE